MKMNNDQSKRVITEFAALERELDTILFRRRDDDDDSPWKTTAEVGAVGAGLGGAAYGINALRNRGLALNTAPSAPENRFVLPGTKAPEVTQWGGKIPSIPNADGLGGRSSTILPNIHGPIAGADSSAAFQGASKGFLGDTLAGGKAFGGEAMAGGKAFGGRALGGGKALSEQAIAALKKLFKGGVKAVA